MKYKLTTNLSLLKKLKSKHYGYKYEEIVNYLGKDYPEEQEINLLTILDVTGFVNFLWSFRATIQDSKYIKNLIFNALLKNQSRLKKQIDYTIVDINQSICWEIDDLIVFIKSYTESKNVDGNRYDNDINEWKKIISKKKCLIKKYLR